MLASLSIASRKLSSLLLQTPWWQTVIISVLQMRCRDLPHSCKWEVSPLDLHVQCPLPPAHQLMPLARWLQHQGFPGGSHGKESACRAGDLGSIPGSGRRPGEGGQSWCVLFALSLTSDTAHPGASRPSATLKIGGSMSAIPSDLSQFHTHIHTHAHELMPWGS